MSTKPSSINTRLSECFNRAKQLSLANNFEYAHTLLAECVIHDPANLAFVEGLLENLRRKVPHPAKKLFNFGGSSRQLKQAVAEQKWSEALSLGLECLKSNPWDVATLRTLAEVSAKLHHNQVELAYLKQALDAAPKDLEVNRHCARSLARMGQFDQAIACWHRIETVRPGDQEAVKMISQLAAEKLKHPAGRPHTAASVPEPISASTESPDSEADADSPPAAAPSSQTVLTGPIAGRDPYDVSTYLDRANEFVEAKNYYAAEAVLKQGIVTLGKHSALERRLSSVEAQRDKQEARSVPLPGREVSAEREPGGIPWLEMGLVVAGVALVLQIFPGALSALWRGIDFRTWSQTSWIFAMLAIISALFLFRLNGSGELSRRVFASTWLVPIMLFLQAIPEARAATWRMIDLRQWTLGNWLMAGIGIPLILAAIYFGPRLLSMTAKRPKQVHGAKH